MSELGSLIRSLAGRPSVRNFHSYVINQIGSGIAAGRYPQGSILPNDAEMMATFDVSRTVLREALKTLESKGMVEARPKVGTKVSPRSRWNHFDLQVLAWIFEGEANPEFVLQVRNIRLALEPQAAAVAAKSRTANDIRMMNYWIQQMEKAVASPLNFAIADYEFHVVLADVSANNFIRSALGVTEIAHCFAYQNAVRSEKGIEAAIVKSHAGLLQAIERMDEDRAVKLATTTINRDFEMFSK